MQLQTILLFCLAITLSASAQMSGEVAGVVEANSGFALRLYRVLSQKPGNVFLSPYNISAALAMAYAGAAGETKKEMADAMNIRIASERYHKGFAAIDSAIAKGGRSYDLLTATRLWGDQQYRFSPAFLGLLHASYGTGSESLDFRNNTEASRMTINKWVEAKTKKRIPELLPVRSISPDTRLVLTSAIYFKASWMRPFHKQNTKQGEFHLASGQTVRVPMMHRSMLAGYLSTADTVGVVLPYAEQRLAMLLLMPKVGDIGALEERLTVENLRKHLASMGTHLVDLAVPRFRVSSSYQLAEPLAKLGMRRAFDPRLADFGPMAASGERTLFLKEGFHQAFVDVNEDGTEATAATGFVADQESVPPRGRFHADRPFLFVIFESGTRSILFIGRIADPRQTNQ